jgi:membrane protein required for colicin V production
MNWIDALILILIIGFSIGGLFRGLIKEVGSLVGVIGGIFLGYRFNPVLVKLLDKFLPLNQQVLAIIAFSVVFLSIVIIAQVLMNLLNKLVKSLLLGGVDRIFGFLFGGIKGLFISSILVILISLFSFLNSVERALLESKLATGTAKVAPFLYQKISGKEISDDLNIEKKIQEFIFEEEPEEEGQSPSL